MRADRRFLWLWLAAATTLSVGGNVGHAWLTVGPGATRAMAICWAVAPPALLMLAIHGLPTLARMLDRGERDPILTAVVWGVTVGAFGWSAVGIFGFSTAMGVPAPMAWVAPVVIDLSVFGATRGLVLTAPLAARFSATRAAAHRGIAGASTARTRIATPDSAVTCTQAPPLSSGGNRPGVEPAAPPPLPAVSEGDTVAGRGSAAPVPDAVRLAEHIVASGAVRKPVETVAAILDASVAERRKAAIAEHIGVHHSVVTKTLEAAEAHRRASVAAVG